MHESHSIVSIEFKAGITNFDYQFSCLLSILSFDLKFLNLPQLDENKDVNTSMNSYTNKLTQNSSCIHTKHGHNRHKNQSVSPDLQSVTTLKKKLHATTTMMNQIQQIIYSIR